MTMHGISILTLMTDPDVMPLSAELVREVEKALQAEGAETSEKQWLAEGEACDLPVRGLAGETLEPAVRGVLAEKPVDWIVQPEQGRRKRALLCDMDSTMITIECVDELADFAGYKAEVAIITEKAMNGELDFREALRARVKLLEGLPEAVLQQAYDERVEFMPGGRELVQTMRAEGAYCLLVSGGFTFFTSRVREALGFHADQANVLEVRDGKLTGQVVEPILDKNAKLCALYDVCREKHLPQEAVLAVGDGANDLPMLQAAGIGIAYHAKATVQRQARYRISHVNLRGVLFAQGYRVEEFVS